MPSKHVEGVYPKYIEKGDGAYVWADDGKKYIDFPCGLGAVLLGYNHPVINEAIRDQLGKGVLFSLPNYSETELAEKICNIIPSAEMIRFVKTGSEATTAAVRIARAYTGKPTIMCCGYHGWHDWYNWTTPKHKGVLKQNVAQFTYNNYVQIEQAFHRRNIAAVIMEPYILEEPKDDFLRKVRKLCSQHKAVLIFDEIITGFRTLEKSAQKYFGIEPDLTCLGKALGNGLPIGAVCGQADLMKELEGDCFVSSTFGGELLSIAAALATLKLIEEQGVIRHIWTQGERLKNAFNSMVQSMRLGDEIKCIGYPPRTFFIFPNEALKSLFWQECLGMGVLFGYAQFINFSHRHAEIDTTIRAMRRGLEMVRKYKEHPLDGLRGKPAEETFRLVAEKASV